MEKKSEMTHQELKDLKKKIAIRFSIISLFLVSIVLLPAGTLNYWQAYIYFAVLVVPMILVILYFIKQDPKFLERRTKAKEKEKQQLLLSSFSTIIFLAGFVIPGLDHRFDWSHVPIYLVIVADVMVFLGYLIIIFVFKQNSYASRIIEVNENQNVILTGLYGVVRHPMYVGVIIMFLPTPIALGSYWGLIPMAFLPVILVLRIINEEKVLSSNLAGYKEYCQKTKYRLIPFIW